MSDNASALASSPAPEADAEYHAICATLMATARGRLFLAELARRNRSEDIALLLAASERIEMAMRDQRAAQSVENIRFDLREMAKAIARTKSEIAAIKPQREQHGKIGDATAELDSIVRSTERATSDILAATERVQKTASTMREQGIDSALCDRLDAGAMEIYTACEFQDLTGQRIQKVIQVLHYLEGRINAMIDIWGEDASDAPVPAPAHSDMATVSDQSDVDMMMQSAPQARVGNETPAEIARDVAQPTEECAPAVSWFDGMPAREPVAAEPAQAPSSSIATDEFADLFEPADPEMRAPAPAGKQLPDTVWIPLDVGLPDWTETTNGSGAKRAAASVPSAPGPQQRTKPQEHARDPLAALNAMSDEEKIALFS